MSESFFGILGATVIVGYTFAEVIAPKNRKLIGVLILFGSFLAFAQNFSLGVFRPLHQLIQITCSLLFLINFNFYLHKFNYYFLAFLFFISLSFLFSPIDTNAIVALINIISVILITNYIFYHIDSKIDLEAIFNYLAGAGVILAVLGIMEFLATGVARVEVTSANPNYYALTLGICYICLASSNRFKSKIPLLGIIFFAIALSGSRSAIIAPILFHLWKSFVTKGVLKSILFSLTMGGMVFIIAISTNSRFFDTSSFASSDVERLLVAKVAVKMTSDQPYSGVGWGRFISEWPNYTAYSEEVILEDGASFELKYEQPKVTHNDFLRISSELGIFALLLFVFMVLRSIKKAYVLREENMIGLFPILLTMTLFSLTHNNLNSFIFWFLFFIPYLNFLKYPQAGSRII